MDDMHKAREQEEHSAILLGKRYWVSDLLWINLYVHACVFPPSCFDFFERVCT